MDSGNSGSDDRGALHRDYQLNPRQFEKGGHCKKAKADASPKIAPKSQKTN